MYSLIKNKPHDISSLLLQQSSSFGHSACIADVALYALMRINSYQIQDMD